MKGIVVGNQLKEAKRRYRKYLWLWIFPFLLIACLIASYFGIIKKADIRDIYNGDDFVKAVKYNSLNKNSDIYTLKDDVVLNEKHLKEIDSLLGPAGEKGACFYGTLDGLYVDEVTKKNLRHTLTIKQSEESLASGREASAVLQSLFYIIENSAVIKNIDIRFELEYKVPKGVDEAALLARINKGTISNISIKGIIDTSEAVCGEDDCHAIGGLFAYNYGKISKCTADIEFKVNSEFCQDKHEKIWNCYVGSLAAFNLYKATDADKEEIATVTMTVENNNFSVLARSPYNTEGDINDKFGFAFGYCAYRPNKKIDVIFTDENNVYMRNASDAEFIVTKEVN